MTRRNFLTRSLKTVAALAAGGGAAAFLGIYHCRVNHCEIHPGGISPGFDRFRIALLSDFHHSPWIPASYIRQVVELTNSLQPDLIALTGDYVHHGGSWAAGCFRELAGLRSRHGSVGVLGNHDHYDNAGPIVRDGLRRAGITDLTNCGLSITRGRESLHLAGTGDYWREKQKLSEALSGVRRPKSAILLQHNPDYVERLHDERIGLVLSGHTHGGQCVFPILGAPILPSRYGQKYVSGLCQGPETQVFVTRGVGVAFPPIRIGCPAEVALLTLRSGNPA
jgi:uncharacterized protein